MSSTYISAALRRQVLNRAGSCCEYCRIAQEDQFFTFEIDHIIAEQHGGITVEANLCLACTDCNGFKGSNIASVDWAKGENIVGLFNPRRDIWQEHFQIELTSGLILSLTACGRVTAFLLRLNTPERVMDRKLLLAENRYPCGEPQKTQ